MFDIFLNTVSDTTEAWPDLNPQPCIKGGGFKQNNVKPMWFYMSSYDNIYRALGLLTLSGP